MGAVAVSRAHHLPANDPSCGVLSFFPSPPGAARNLLSAARPANPVPTNLLDKTKLAQFGFRLLFVENRMRRALPPVLKRNSVGRIAEGESLRQ